MKIRKKHQFYISKKCYKEEYIDLFLIWEEGKRHYVLIKDNAFMYDYTLHRGKKHFCCKCLQAVITEKKY